MMKIDEYVGAAVECSNGKKFKVSDKAGKKADTKKAAAKSKCKKGGKKA